MTTMVIPAEAPTKTAVKTLPPLRIAVHIDTEVLNPEVARRKANVWLLMYAGNLLRADYPELILKNEQLLWRYDVLLTQPGHGVVGKIGCLHVGAKTGEVTEDPSIYGELNANARALLKQKGLPVLADEEYSCKDNASPLMNLCWLG